MSQHMAAEKLSAFKTEIGIRYDSCLDSSDEVYEGGCATTEILLRESSTSPLTIPWLDESEFPSAAREDKKIVAFEACTFQGENSGQEFASNMSNLMSSAFYVDEAEGKRNVQRVMDSFRR